MEGRASRFGSDFDSDYDLFPAHVQPAQFEPPISVLGAHKRIYGNDLAIEERGLQSVIESKIVRRWILLCTEYKFLSYRVCTQSC